MADSPQLLERRNVLAEMARSLMVWMRRYAPIDEFARCDQEELEHVARDVGVPASELRILATKRPDAAQLLYRRLAALGLDQDELRRAEPAVLRDLQRLCSLCERRKRCVLDLGERPASPVWQEYCPNALTLCGLVASQPEPDQLDSLIAYLNAGQAFGPQDCATPQDGLDCAKH